MVKTILIDDESHCIEDLRILLSPYKTSFQILDEASTVAKAIESVQKHSPDLIFLDVQIGEKSGFDLLREIGNLNFDVIFTTAFEKYAIQAFKFSAFDYLLKPILAEDFDQVINRYEKFRNRELARKKLEVLFENLNSVNSPKRLTVPTMEGYEFFELDEILRCESDGNYTTIHLVNKRKLTVSKTLKTFEDLLNDQNFFRIHNSHLVNLRYIIKYSKGKGGFITLIDGNQVEVSTRRKEEFLKRLV